ncbi:MAG TPA: hypothetical protein VKU61_05110 [Candidatus Binatia bacterium]|nr:hypothetical protein [Candidatus Binatia bacterium]
MQLDISLAERELLIRLVEHALSDTRVEVRRTATPEFYDRLAAEERDLAGLLARLRRLAVS